MRLENDKIYVDDLCIAVIDRGREVIEVLKKIYLNNIIDFAVSNKELKDYRWETYSPEE